MRCESRACGLAVSRYDIDDASRNAGFHREFAQPQRGQWRFLGGFKDDRAAGGDGGADLLKRWHRADRSRNDGADDADGFLQRVGEDIAG